MEYETTAELYELTDDQKLKYLPSILKEDALRYYNAKIKNSAETYDDAVQMIRNQFNGRARQTQFKSNFKVFASINF